MQDSQLSLDKIESDSFEITDENATPGRVDNELETPGLENKTSVINKMKTYN